MAILLYIICFLFFSGAIFSVLKNTSAREEIYYLAFSNVLFHLGLFLFYVIFHNLYFSFFSSFFCILFPFFLLKEIKGKTKYFLWAIPYFLFQIYIFLFLFVQFFQSF